MTSLRRHIRDRRTLALWLALLAFAVKLLVPAGFMVGIADGRPVLQLCSGTGPMVMPIAGPMHGAMAGGDMAGMPMHPGDGAMATGGHGRGDDAQADTPCPFAALAQGIAAPPAADGFALPPMLAPIATGGAVATTILALALHLRPPPRAPPTRS